MRRVVSINRDKCIGCGNCAKTCPAGCLYLKDNVIELISEEVCEGAGGCAVHCPVDALKIVEKETYDFNFTKVMDNIIGNGEDALRLYLSMCLYYHEDAKYKEFTEYLASQNREIPEHDSNYVNYLKPDVRELYYKNVVHREVEE